MQFNLDVLIKQIKLISMQCELKDLKKQIKRESSKNAFINAFKDIFFLLLFIVLFWFTYFLWWKFSLHQYFVSHLFVTLTLLYEVWIFRVYIKRFFLNIFDLNEQHKWEYLKNELRDMFFGGFLIVILWFLFTSLFFYSCFLLKIFLTSEFVS